MNNSLWIVNLYIADDEINICNIIKSFLIKEGFDVETFNDGISILEAFNKRQADMLVIDIMMPGMDGYSLCSSIRKKSSVPIIIVSAKDTETDKIAGLSLGSDDYLTKPFSPMELIARVRSIFRRIELDKSSDLESEPYSYFTLSGTEYAAIIKPVSQKNTFGLGWIVIYSSLQKVNQLQTVISIILFSILILSVLIIVIFSSRAAKKISAPFSSLNRHIEAIAERNFGTKIQLKVDDELQEFVENINVMSERLETYDKAQKTFLQNVSHAFRTPLMSIQSYAESIKYEVVDNDTAADQ